METLVIHSNIYSKSVQTQHQFQTKASLTKLADIDRQKSQDQDIVRRKKEVEHLNIGEEKLLEIIEKANKILLRPPTELRYSVHERTKRISIKIINTESQEIIREIPPEKVLDMVANLWELAGLLVDEKA